LKSSDFSLLIYCFPFSYFWKSRLKTLKDWAFHSWNEWIVNILILLVANNFDIVKAITYFTLGYGCFISFYEIGYIINDFYAVKKEEKPRLRFGNKQVPNLVLWAWIGLRAALFIVFLFYFDFSIDVILFYAGLGVVFALHNVLVSKGLKSFTFLQLAVFRFWAPVFLFIPKELVATLFPVVFFYYVFNRTLTYMDSKNILNLPERTSVDFKLMSSLILVSFTTFWSYFSQSWVSLGVALYFILFWVLIKMVGRNFSSNL
jgi:hypothetical protein